MSIGIVSIEFNPEDVVSAKGSAKIEVDFTNLTDAKRDVLEIALKNTKLEQLTAYVKGHEFDSKFNLSISHAGLDKFLITVKNNEPVIPDIYTLVAVGRLGEKSYVIETLFDWGVSNNTKFF